jgi:hypothetical protein
MKTYADECLERASKATEGPWTREFIYIRSKDFPVADTADRCEADIATVRGWGHLQYKGEKIAIEIQDANGEFIAHSRTDVVELARRLNRACEMLRDNDDGTGIQIKLADELEASLENRCRHNVHGTDCFTCYPVVK